MSYSCTDFCDTILEALAINVRDEDNDDPAAQADLALKEIARLQTIEKQYLRLLNLNNGDQQNEKDH